MKLVVASGKGGVGKTSVAVNLAAVAAATPEHPLLLLDGDVEAPNVRLFLDGAPSETREVCLPVPQIDAAKCSGCGKCACFCQFHALVCFGETPLVFPDLCHSCGGCIRLCPHKAITEVPRRIGVISGWRRGGLVVREGRLDVGVASAAPLVRALKAEAATLPTLPTLPTLIDAPPGTACPAVAALEGCVYALLVAEATRFGLNDLTLIVAAARTLKLRFGVVVNRTVPGRTAVQDYCRRENIDILAEIPEDRHIAEIYARGEILVEAEPSCRPLFADLWQTLQRRAAAGERAA